VWLRLPSTCCLVLFRAVSGCSVSHNFAYSNAALGRTWRSPEINSTVLLRCAIWHGTSWLCGENFLDDFNAGAAQKLIRRLAPN